VKIPKHTTGNQIYQVEEWLSLDISKSCATCPWTIGVGYDLEGACKDRGGYERCARWFPSLTKRRVWCDWEQPPGPESEIKCPCDLLNTPYIRRRASAICKVFRQLEEEKEIEWRLENAKVLGSR